MAVLGAVALLSFTRPSSAKPPLSIDIQPMLGTATPAVDGWLSAYVRIENHSGQVVRGNLAVDAVAGWSRFGGGSTGHNTTQVPFSVAAHAQVAVEVPVHGFPGSPPGLRATAVSRSQ